MATLSGIAGAVPSVGRSAATSAATQSMAELGIASILGAGFVQQGHLEPTIISALSKATFSILLPMFLCTSIIQSVTKYGLNKSSLAVPLLAIVQSTCLFLASKFILLPLASIDAESDEGRATTVCCSFGNSGVVPLIFCESLFRHSANSDYVAQSTAFVSLFLIGWSPFFWSFGRSVLIQPFSFVMQIDERAKIINVRSKPQLLKNPFPLFLLGYPTNQRQTSTARPAVLIGSALGCGLVRFDHQVVEKRYFGRFGAVAAVALSHLVMSSSDDGASSPEAGGGGAAGTARASRSRKKSTRAAEADAAEAERNAKQAKRRQQEERRKSGGGGGSGSGNKSRKKRTSTASSSGGRASKRRSQRDDDVDYDYDYDYDYDDDDDDDDDSMGARGLEEGIDKAGGDGQAKYTVNLRVGWMSLTKAGAIPTGRSLFATEHVTLRAVITESQAPSFRTVDGAIRVLFDQHQKRGIGAVEGMQMATRLINGPLLADAKTMTLADLCRKVRGDSGVWDASKEEKDIWLVVLRDGYDQKPSAADGAGAGIRNSFDVPCGRLAEYKLGDLVDDGLVSLSAGSKVCFEVEYRKKVESGFCTFGGIGT